jgi:hypothetical protein
MLLVLEITVPVEKGKTRGGNTRQRGDARPHSATPSSSERPHVLTALTKQSALEHSRRRSRRYQASKAPILSTDDYGKPAVKRQAKSSGQATKLLDADNTIKQVQITKVLEAVSRTWQFGAGAAGAGAIGGTLLWRSGNGGDAVNLDAPGSFIVDVGFGKGNDTFTFGGAAANTFLSGRVDGGGRVPGTAGNFFEQNAGGVLSPNFILSNFP